MVAAMGMSEKSTEEYTKKMRARYARLTGRQARGKLLDELIKMTGWERKHANKVLLGKRRSEGRRGKRGAPKKYGVELTRVLKTCWLAMEQPCGKRMKDMLPLWSKHLDCPEENRSEAQIDCRRQPRRGEAKPNQIQGFLLDQYKVDVGADFISTVTDSVMEEVKEWQNRALEEMYPVVFFDALRVKIRDEGTVKNKAIYLALGMSAEGTKEVLGIWVEQNEGAKFWLKVMNELRNRGVEDILIAVVDGLKGFPEAITTVFPEANVQTCIVHLIRHNLSFCGWKDRQKVATELKSIYRAENAEVAKRRLEEFEAGLWGKKFPMIAQSWKRNWEQIIPFFAYGPEIRKMIYTTNAIESLHMQIRKVLKTRGHFPSDESATKLIYLALRNITKKWNKPPVTWKAAAGQFAIQFGDLFFPSAMAKKKTGETELTEARALFDRPPGG